MGGFLVPFRSMVPLRAPFGLLVASIAISIARYLQAAREEPEARAAIVQQWERAHVRDLQEVLATEGILLGRPEDILSEAMH